ncbi:MAG: hypothetical protein FWH57_11890 [Oscillospiraceae bacterium]|nr:hypothetical protein [Oscillospiraceae bacterium]
MKKIITHIRLDKALALVFYVSACLVLYFVQYVWFGSAFRTVFFLALIYPPIYLIFGINNEAKPIKQSRRKLFGALYTAVLVVIGVVLSVYDILKGDSLIGYQAIGVIFVLGVLVMIKKFPRLPKITTSYVASAIYASILIVTAAVILITKPITINASGKSLSNNGYQNVSYLKCYQKDEIVLNILFDGKLTDPGGVADGLGVYLFSADIDGTPYGILVDIASGDTVFIDNADENRILAGVIEMLRKN